MKETAGPRRRRQHVVGRGRVNRGGGTIAGTGPHRSMASRLASDCVMAITKWSIETHQFGALLNGEIVRPTDGQDVRSHPMTTKETTHDSQDNFRRRYRRRHRRRRAHSDRSFRRWWRQGWWWNG